MTAISTRSARPDRHPVLHGLWAGASYGLLGLVLLLTALVVIVPKAVGGMPLTILSGSMEPSLPVGSLAVVRPVQPDDVRIGDVITYLPKPNDPTAISHRVVAVGSHDDGSRTFTLKGDANDATDAPVEGKQIRARVWYSVPLLGYVNSALNGTHRSTTVYAVAGLLFAWAAVLWARATRNRLSSRRTEGDGDRRC